MPWLNLLLALAAFAVAFMTSSMRLMVACLLAALGLVLAWAMGVHARRVGTRRDAVPLPRDPAAQDPRAP